LVIGGVSSLLDSFVVTENSVLRINFCGEKSATSAICETLPASLRANNF
jgi:hypothetical protein